MKVCCGPLRLGAVALAFVGCHTITEELPTQPPLRNTVVVVNPAGVTPGPGASPTPGPTPAPTPPPPESKPTPEPTPEPTPAPSNPIARVTIGTMYVVCDGVKVPNSERATTARVGCRLHLDLNAKDAHNKPTGAEGEPEWRYDDMSLVRVLEDPFSPILTALDVGRLRVTASWGGVTSNELLLEFYR